jgi:hypothetical protein
LLDKGPSPVKKNKKKKKKKKKRKEKKRGKRKKKREAIQIHFIQMVLTMWPSHPRIIKRKICL